MDVVFDPERERVWTVCDDTCDGKFSLLQIVDGTFAVAEAYDRPVTMPNLNNEGLAIAPQSTCVDGEKQVVWSDDGDTDGFSLRSGTIQCTELPPVTVPGAPEAATAAPGPKGGNLTVTLSWTPPVVTGGTPITGYRLVTYKLDARGSVLSETTLDVPASSQTVVLTLKQGRYSFAVAAGNAVGYGELSPVSAVVKPR